MRAISLWQPYASAIALGIKHIETRSWSTAYRGLLAIHAAKRWEGWQREFAAEEHTLGSHRVAQCGRVITCFKVKL